MDNTQILIANFPSGKNVTVEAVDVVSNKSFAFMAGYDIKDDSKERKLAIINDIITGVLTYNEIIIFANNITECIDYLGYDNVSLLLREKILKIIPDFLFCPILTKENEIWKPSFISYSFGHKDVSFKHKLGHIEYWLYKNKYNNIDSLLYLLENNSIDLSLEKLQEAILKEDKRDCESLLFQKDDNLFKFVDGVPYINIISELRLHCLNTFLHVASNLQVDGLKTDGKIKNILEKKAQSILYQEIPDGIDAISSVNRQKGIPNFGELYVDGILSMNEIVKLRNSKDGMLFKKWVQEDGFDEKQMIQDVMNSVSNMFGKTISQGMRILACNVVSILGFLPGIMASTIDNIIFDKILKGWHPNFFLDDKLKVLIDKKVEEKKKEQEIEHLRKRFKGVERNQLCPCGSGLKFKKCHGKQLL